MASPATGWPSISRALTPLSDLGITNNQITGGGVVLANAGTVAITGNTIDAASGTAISLAGGITSAAVNSNSITNSGGRGIEVSTNLNLTQNTGITVNFNRLFGNSQEAVAIVAPGDYDGTLDATNNWWGSNAGPAPGSILGDVDADPWLVLSITPNLNTIGTGGTTLVVASLTTNSNAEDVGSGFPDGIAIAFGAVGGTVDPASATTLNGEASTAFTSAAAGDATVSATLDDQTVESSIITVQDITFDPTPLPPTTVDVPYGPITLTGATGGAGGFVYTLTGGALPAGSTLNLLTLELDGTPTEAGTFAFTLTATDASGATATADYTLQVNEAIVLDATAPPESTVGIPYNFQILATGGTGVLTFAVTSGALPDGLSLDPATGLISGTPTTEGSSTFDITATDEVGASATQPYTIVINAAPVIDTTTLPGTTVGVAYDQTIVVTGGTLPITFAVTTGALPDGLSLDPATGQITGTPTTVGGFDFEITATDAVGAQAVQAYSVTIAATPVIDQETLPDWTVGASYSQQLTVTGGTAPITFAVTDGALPDGLALDPDTGAISGTPTTEGSFAFTITATDAVGVQDSQAFTVVINAVPVIDQTTLPATTVGTVYDQQLTVTGGTAPITWSITSGALPDGLTLDPDTGLISGTTTTTGVVPFTVTATDAAGVTASQDFVVTVNAQPVLNPAVLPAGVVGLAYNQQLTVDGGTAPFSFAVTDGALPDGLTLDPDTGLISGTPTTEEVAAFTVTATDASGATASRAYSITINAALAIDQAVLPEDTVGVAYNAQLTVTGGTAPFTWAVTEGALPDGLTLDPDTGLISGTPTTAGSFDFTVTVTDADTNTASQPFTVVINALPVIDQTSLPGATVGTPYSQQLTVTGGTAPVTFAVTNGALPDGLSLDADGLIFGTPTTEGSFAFTVTATDAVGVTATQDYTIVVSAAPVIDQTTLPDSEVGLDYSQQLTVTGGTAPITWSITSGALPDGLTLDPDTGLISGTPTTAGSFAFTVTATDGAGAQASQPFTVAIAEAPVIDQTTLPATTVGATYDQTLTVTGGVGPFTWAVTAGALPDGLTLDPDTGLISGTPTTAGSFAFTVTATDSLGGTAVQPFSVVVNAAPVIDQTTLPDATANQPYSQQLTVTGGTTPITWSITSGALPDGLTLNPDTGAITGTPTAAGSSTFTVTATDAADVTASQEFTVVVNAAPVIDQTTLPGGEVGVAYSQQLSVTGGTAPITFAVTDGTLPDGLTLSPGGLISGTPTAAGSFNFTITATDANGATASQAFDVTVAAAPTISPTVLPDAVVNTPYSQQLNVSGGTGPFTWSVSSGSLPAGLTLDSGTGLISGTPTTVGSSTFTVTVTDSLGGVASQQYTIQVNQTLAINQATLPDATAGTAYNQQLTVTGGTAPFTWTVSSGSLPPGLSLSSSGLLSGTPTTAGTFGFTVTVTDANGASASQPFTFVVRPPAVIAPTVTNLQRFGFHAQPTSFVISFSQAMDPTRAQNVANYRIVPVGGTRPIKITRAVYDAATNTVTLFPRNRVTLFRQFTLTINGTAPDGLTNASGVLLDGAGNGVPGSNYVQTFGRDILAGPAPSRASARRAARALKLQAAAAARTVVNEPLSPRAVDAVLHAINVPGRRR
jgi:hypothetical protein